MKRRELFVMALKGLSLSAAAGVLAACAPVLENPAAAPDAAFTPAGVDERLKGVRTLAEVSALYGDSTRTFASSREGNSVAVWEWMGFRPSFHAKKSVRSYCTPTVKKELQVLCDADKNVLDYRLVGMFYVQYRLPGLSARAKELRMLDAAELASFRVPVAAEEDWREVNAYYERRGEKSGETTEDMSAPAYGSQAPAAQPASGAPASESPEGLSEEASAPHEDSQLQKPQAPQAAPEAGQSSDKWTRLM